MGHKRFNLVGRRWLKVSQSIKFSASEVIGGKTKSLTLFGLGGAKCPPLKVFANYLRNSLADLHETL